MSLSFSSSGGNRFQTAGAATRKQRFPKQTVRVRGTVRSPLSADRSRARPATEPTGQQSINLAFCVTFQAGATTSAARNQRLDVQRPPDVDIWRTSGAMEQHNTEEGIYDVIRSPAVYVDMSRISGSSRNSQYSNAATSVRGKLSLYRMARKTSATKCLSFSLHVDRI